MNGRRIQQETGRVLFAALAVWATAMAGAAVEGVPGMFGDAALAAFGAAAALFAAVSYQVDAELRAFGREVSRRTLTLAAAAGLAGVLAALAVHAVAFAVFAAPIAALALAARLDRGLERRGATRASAKSPGARPAAT